MNMKTGLLAICVLGTVGFAQAGAVFRTKVENFTKGNQFFEGGKSYTTVTKVDGNRMRVDTVGEDGKMATSMIFLGDTDEMYMIDHGKKTYIVMDRESIDALANQLSGAMKQMQEALAQVPPAQREMMERMMKQKMGADPNAKPPSPPVVESLGKNGSVNGIGCDWKAVLRDDVLSEKACVCDQGKIAGGKEMVAIAYEMKDFAAGLRKLATSASNSQMFGGGTMAEYGATVTADLGGFPLISEHYDDKGKLMQRSTFQSADDVAVPAQEFTPPSGYKKQTMRGMAR